MQECCEGCGHFWCPCGITWDEAFEGGPYAFNEAEEVEEWLWHGAELLGEAIR